MQPLVLCVESQQESIFSDPFNFIIDVAQTAQGFRTLFKELP